MNSEINKIVNILNSGGVVALPTDTVYGLVGLYGNEKAFNKIYEIKNRPSDKKLILFIDKIDRLNDFCENIDKDTNNYLNSIWPGNVSVILNCKNNDGICFRIPNNKLILDIIKTIDRPLYSTSANISGNKSIKNYKDLELDIVNKVDYLVEGVCDSGIPSSIIDLRDNKKNIIRK